MTVVARQLYTYGEFVELEEMSPVKHEYLDRAVWAMAGGTPDHAAIAANVIGMLREQLRGRRCRVFTSDLRVRVKATGLGTYPDASVICDSIEFDSEDAKGHTVVNPTVLVEVLSPSTEIYDRGERRERPSRRGVHHEQPDRSHPGTVRGRSAGRRSVHQQPASLTRPRVPSVSVPMHGMRRHRALV